MVVRVPRTLTQLTLSRARRVVALDVGTLEALRSLALWDVEDVDGLEALFALPMLRYVLLAERSEALRERAGTFVARGGTLMLMSETARRSRADA